MFTFSVVVIGSKFTFQSVRDMVRVLSSNNNGNYCSKFTGKKDIQQQRLKILGTVHVRNIYIMMFYCGRCFFFSIMKVPTKRLSPENTQNNNLRYQKLFTYDMSLRNGPWGIGARMKGRYAGLRNGVLLFYKSSTTKRLLPENP